MKRFLIAALVFFAFTPAFAQMESVAVDKSKPLEITADQTLEWHRNDNKYIARGNVVARQGAAAIHADVMTADYDKTQKSSFDISTLIAEGHVLISSQGNEASGDHAVYDVRKGIATMTGSALKLTGPDQVVTANERFEYAVNEGRLSAFGGARATRGQNTITADSLSAWFAQAANGQRKLDRLGAEGHVVINTPEEVLHGDKGEYNATTQLATLTGHVRIERGPNVLEGEKAEVNLATNVSRMIGNTAGGGRVRGVFYPGTEKTPGPAAPAPQAAAPAAGLIPPPAGGPMLTGPAPGTAVPDPR